MRVSTIISTILLVAGCSAGDAATEASPSGASSSDATGAAPSGGSAAGTATVQAGRVHLRLVDAPNPAVSAVIVTVDHVDADVAGGGWTTIASAPLTVDLLKLQGGAFASLAEGGFPTGHINQLRLFLSESSPAHVVTEDGEHELSVPSGVQSGIKIVGGFDVGPCQTGEVTIDFDAGRSVSYHGGSASPNGGGAGGWSLKPVIKLKSVSLSGECADAGDGADAAPPDAAPASETSCEGVSCADGEFCLNGTCSAAS